MPSWNRDSDRALDAELRAARPEPTPEVTRAIADRVRPRQTAGTHRFGHVHLALAGGLTALVLTPVVAMGFGGLGHFGKAHKTKAKASLVSKATKGRSLGALTTNRSRALSSLARMGGGASSLAAMAPAGGGAALATQDSPGAFFGDIFSPQNDFQATQDEYALVCGLTGIIQDNDGTITQGANTATGGNATSTGGAGGNANTGNTQTNTGGATGSGLSFGGDTTATSGNATGGAGGDATSTGGDAVAGNVADQTLLNAVICAPAG